jgi:hypothetical protein
MAGCDLQRCNRKNQFDVPGLKVYGLVAFVRLLQGPLTLVADCKVPPPIQEIEPPLGIRLMVSQPSESLALL